MFDPFQDPFGDPGMPPVPVQVMWDYEKHVVVSDGLSTLFDTCWTYYFYGADQALRWGLSRYIGDHMYVAERAVPEMVRLAVMVSE